MGILDNDNLRAYLQDNVVGFVPSHIASACYELSLGNEYYTTNSEPNGKVKVEDGGIISIEPGQFAILITKETVTIPDDILALISIKFTAKFRGLVNVSGFHVDPGFHGKLKFSVYNAGSRPIVLDVGKPLFPMWFCQLTSPLHKDNLYNGSHNKQSEITANDISQIQGKIYSPNVLRDELQRIENVELKRVETKIETSIETLQGKINNVDVKRTVITTILVAILMLLITTVANVLLNSTSVDLWRDQGKFENKFEGLANRATNSSERIDDLERRVSQIEKTSNSAIANK